MIRAIRLRGAAPMLNDPRSPIRSLKPLNLSLKIEIFLSLVHARDGIEGTKKRIEAVRPSIEKFRISNEPGLSRARAPNFVEDSSKLRALTTQG